MKLILFNLLLASWDCKDLTSAQIYPSLPLGITGVALTDEAEGTTGYYDDYAASGDYAGSGDNDYEQPSKKRHFLDGMRKKLGMVSCHFFQMQ